MSAPKVRGYLTAAQVAADVFPNKSLDWFYRHVKALQRRGFPKPVPLCGYDPASIEAWQDMELLGCFAQTEDKRTGNIVLLDDAALERAAMERV